MEGRHRRYPYFLADPKALCSGPSCLTYINDINSNISGTIQLFADDALLFRQIRSDADCLSLQKDLDTLYSWARKWRMQCNASKCHVLQVTRKKSIITHDYSLGQYTLKSVVPSHPYIGIEIDNKLSWKQTIEKTKNKSIRTLNIVKRNFTKLYNNTHKKPDLHRISPPHIGIWIQCMEPPPDDSNTATRESSEHMPDMFCRTGIDKL